jgi:2-haloacid dehalogenase
MTRAAGLAGAALLSKPANAADRPAKFAAIAFDAFPIFDPRPVAALCEALFPGRGGDLVNLWRCGNSNMLGCDAYRKATRTLRV